jgi:hypothetical protein
MKYESADYMRYLSEFILSEGDKYQYLEPAQEDIMPGKASGSFNYGLDGWSYMMRNREKDFSLLYFENGSVKPALAGFIPETRYSLIWFGPMNGEWKKPLTARTDAQ